MMRHEQRGPIAFSRASAGTYWGDNGLLLTAAADQPRFEFDPATGASLGLLVETEATNFLAYSAAFDNAAWSKLACSIVPNAGTAPDGSATAARIIGNTTATFHQVRQVFTSQAARHTFSLFVKAFDSSDANQVRIYLQSNSNALNFTHSGNFDPVAGAWVNATGDNGAGFKTVARSAVYCSGGWWRITFTADIAADVVQASIYHGQAGSVQLAMDGTSGPYLWGAQIEQGEATSYIPTTDGQASRAADVPTFFEGSPLLPPSATSKERVLAMVTGRLGEVPPRLRDVWNGDTCPANVLPWLAWAFGVDEWDPAWPDQFKRATIKSAVDVQRKKGSVWSIRQALRNAGYGEIQLVEGLFGRRYNGSITHNGFGTYGDPTEWAKYRVVLARPIANKQAAQVRRILENTAPARCQLVEFVYTQANNIYDKTIRYDGTYNHGTA